jgi:hypothetical protein
MIFLACDDNDTGLSDKPIENIFHVSIICLPFLCHFGFSAIPITDSALLALQQATRRSVDE